MKVLCKKDYITSNTIHQVNFYKDNFYEIYMKHDDSCWIFSSTRQSAYRFDKLEFENYFLTIIESRKFKLNKIQNELQ